MRLAGFEPAIRVGTGFQGRRGYQFRHRRDHTLRGFGAARSQSLRRPGPDQLLATESMVAYGTGNLPLQGVEVESSSRYPQAWSDFVSKVKEKVESKKTFGRSAHVLQVESSGGELSESPPAAKPVSPRAALV